MLGGLSLENVDVQFCSDSLKEEIKQLIRQRDDAKAHALKVEKAFLKIAEEVRIARERLGPAGWHLLTELTTLRNLTESVWGKLSALRSYLCDVDQFKINRISNADEIAQLIENEIDAYRKARK